MSDHFRLTILDLEQRLQEQLAGVSKTKLTINGLYEAMGEPPPYEDVEGQAGMIAPSLSRRQKVPQVRADEFYGKPLSSAVRQVLALRREADPDNGPATVSEIHRTLKQGGFSFEARDEENQIRGLGVSISKNSALFSRLPNDMVGLADWYARRIVRRRRPESAAQNEIVAEAEAPEALDHREEVL